MDKLKEKIEKLIPIFFTGLILVVLQIISLKELFLLCCLFIITWMIYKYSNLDGDTNDKSSTIEKKDFKISSTQIIFIILTAFTVITICSESSPLYPLNNWVDANCYMTVGRSMLHGLVPYKDLYEQKGPLLYIFHALAALISENSFIGVYFLELIACFFFLYFSYKLMKLFYNRINILSILALAIIVYTALCFGNGDSAEEFCLPFYAYALYLGVKTIHCKKELTNLECFLIGVTAACVLWIKFTLVGFYIGWICVPGFMLIKNRQYKKLFQTFLWIAIGVIVLSIPILLYFALNHAISDLFIVYFYNNISLYSGETAGIRALVENLHNGYIDFRDNNIYTIVSILLGAVVLIKQRDKSDFMYLLTSVVFAFIFIYIGGRYYPYYSSILSAFAPFGIMAVCNAIQNYYELKFNKHINLIFRNFLICAVFFVCIVFIYDTCRFTYLMKYQKSDLPQYQFAEIISRTKGATLLNYDFLDGGFYTAAGIIPTNKYFCKLNVPIDEMMQSQNEIIENGEVDYVVTRDEELKSSIYKCIKASTFGNNTFYLYQLCQ